MYAPSPFLALDYAASSRSLDLDGRLHVRNVAISKSNVCEYRGDEIPKWRELGLSPNRSYRLFRDPAELRKAAASFNHLPILSEHVPVTAADHQPSLVVGATGSNATFDEPYLRNELVVWASPAIMAIDTGAKRELSAAYRYDAVMRPGVHRGERYDGRMTNLVGNHVALVPNGRCGSDVMIASDHATFDERFPHAARLRTAL